MDTTPPSAGGPFSVYQFFSDGTHECVRPNVGAVEAVETAKHYCSCVGAQVGSTCRVIITDIEDCCVFEWKRGEGVTFPPRDC